ncbi:MULTISPECIES: hypothetical protein [unclassified Streptomyces]
MTALLDQASPRLRRQGLTSKVIRTWPQRLDIAHTIPERADQVRNRAMAV